MKKILFFLAAGFLVAGAIYLTGFNAGIETTMETINGGATPSLTVY